jgi:hypothetical protein
MTMTTVTPILSPSLLLDARAYADALDEIGGPTLADSILIEDDENPVSEKAKKKLKGEKRDEVQWICGWFRGVADALGCEAIDVLTASRRKAA